MEVDKSILEHVAKVARIKLSDEEIKKFLPQLKESIEFFSKLNEIDTNNVSPSFHPVELKNAMREDTKKDCLSQDEALSQTEHKKDGYFKGPRAI